MNDLHVFATPEFAGVRVMLQNDEPWFIISDVANAIGYANPQKVYDLLYPERRTSI